MLTMTLPTIKMNKHLTFILFRRYRATKLLTIVDLGGVPERWQPSGGGGGGKGGDVEDDDDEVDEGFVKDGEKWY